MEERGKNNQILTTEADQKLINSGRGTSGIPDAQGRSKTAGTTKKGKEPNQTPEDTKQKKEKSDIDQLQDIISEMVQIKAEKYKGENTKEFDALKDQLRDLVEKNVFKPKDIGKSDQKGAFTFTTSSQDFETIVAVKTVENKILKDKKTIFVWEKGVKNLGYELHQTIPKLEEVDREESANDFQDDDSSFELEIIKDPDAIDKILCIDISKDSLILVSGHKKNGLNIWTRNKRIKKPKKKVKTLKKVQKEEKKEKKFHDFKLLKKIPQSKPVTSVVLSEDNKTLVVGMSDGNVMIFEIKHQGGQISIEVEPTKLKPKLNTGVGHLTLSVDSGTLVAIGSSKNSQPGALVAWSLYKNGSYRFRKK